MRSVLIFIGLWSIGLLHLTAWAQCPDKLDLQAVFAQADVGIFRALALQLEPCPEWRDSLGFLYHKLGTTYYQASDLDSAAFYTKKAFELRQLIGRGEPFLELGKSAFNLGYFYKEQGLYQNAIPSLEVSMKIYDALDEKARLRSVYGQLADAYGRVGAYQKGHTILELAILLDEQSEELESLAGAYLTQGLLFLKQKKYEEALSVLKKGAAISKAFPPSINQARIRYNLAWATDELGDYEKAEREYLKAIELYEALEECKDVAYACNTLGVFYVENQQLTKAIPVLNRGLAAAEACQLPVNIAQSHDHFGEYFLALNQTDKAVRSFQRAQQVLLPGYSPQSLWDIPSREQLYYASNQIDLLIYLKDQARALEAWMEHSKEEAKPENTLMVYRRGDQLIDLIRKSHNNAATKLFWREEVLPFYENAIDLCYRLNKEDEAFYFFEKSKSILLLEALLDNDALRLIPDSLQKRELQLSTDLAETQSQVQQGNDSDQAVVYQDILKKQETLEEFREFLQANYPSYRELTQSLPIMEAAEFYNTELSPSDQLLVHYFWGTENVYVLTVSDTKSTTYSLGETDVIRQALGEVLAFFEAPALIENAPADYLKAAAVLYSLILEPLTIPEGKSLVIVPDGPLTYLPFPALVCEPMEGNTASLSGAPYLLRRHAISYAYSAAILSLQSKRRTEKPLGILAFAPFADGTAPVGYPALDYDQDELEQIRKSHQCEVLKNASADYQHWFAQSSTSDILHLSTHAFSSPQEASPHIAFYDTLLYLHDIYQQQIPTALIVLSACQTNIGRLAPGEGVLGLGRGFVQAGAASIIASLWNVNANSTGKILTSFYENLGNGFNKPLALHEAQLSYLNDPKIPIFQKSPYYWAGLSYYGDSSKLKLAKKRWWKNTWIGISSLLLLSGLLLWWRKPTQKPTQKPKNS